MDCGNHFRRAPDFAAIVWERYGAETAERVLAGSASVLQPSSQASESP